MADLKSTIVPVTPFMQNCAVLWDPATRHGSVVDPGGEAEKILAAIHLRGLTIDSILLTHGHLDHAGGAMDLKRRLAAAGQEAPIIGPDRRDQFLLDGIAEQARAFNVPGLSNCTPDRFLSEGESVTIAGAAFDVLHCPGHTPGHVVFVSRALSLAIVGDVLFHNSVGRTDFPYGDADTLLRGIASKLLPLGDDIAFLCGHGPGSTFGAERRGNPFLAGMGTPAR